MHAAATNDGVLETRNAGLFLLEQQCSLTYICFSRQHQQKRSLILILHHFIKILSLIFDGPACYAARLRWNSPRASSRRGCSYHPSDPTSPYSRVRNKSEPSSAYAVVSNLRGVKCTAPGLNYSITSSIAYWINILSVILYVHRHGKIITSRSFV